ncbi:MAG: twin-arginine translocase subunit TatB [Deltaproteobacteria bacterium]|nr:twin-arginine translocase subunit TatB [Deltaproteobacteria bacterium]
MFGIGMPELLIVLVVALLVLGPRKLPEAARSLGRGMAEFRRASNDLRNSLTAPIDEIKDTVADLGRDLTEDDGSASDSGSAADAGTSEPATSVPPPSPASPRVPTPSTSPAAASSDTDGAPDEATDDPKRDG